MTTPGFEFIDHPADVQVHSWGPNFSDALEQSCLALFDIMFDRSGFGDSEEMSISVKGSDIQNLVYSFLDEFLFKFDVDDFVVNKVKITKCDLENFVIEATANGECFDMDKHSNFRRTEVKAVTYASMKVEQKDGKWEIYVIFDL